MIWHGKKLNRPPGSEEWNNDPHIIDRKALRDFLGISSGGDGGDGVWTHIDSREFTSYATEFTVSDLSAYSVLWMMFSLDITCSASPDTALTVRPNGDSDSSNYVNVKHVFNKANHGYSNNDPLSAMVLCRAGWGRRTLGEGDAYMFLRPTGFMRGFFSNFSVVTYDTAYWGYEEQIGFWKNKGDTISSLTFKISKTGEGFKGWIKIYGFVHE